MSARRKQQDLNREALTRSRVHPDLSDLDGSGVVLCVIDYGFDLLHHTFRTATGETRFAYLLDQNGACLERAHINRRIRQVERTGWRDALDDIYDPHENYFGFDGVGVGAHGSWVASIAAGSQCEDFTGVAPKATLIGVQLDAPDSAWREEDARGQPTWLEAARCGGDALHQWRGWRSYEDNDQIAASIRDAYNLACTLKPDGIVINLSIGAWAGGHDAGSSVNRAITEIAQTNDDVDAPMTAVIAATGNAGCDHGHAEGDIAPDESMKFTWLFDADAASQSKLEIWSDTSGGIDVTLSDLSQSAHDIIKLGAGCAGTKPIRIKQTVLGVAENRGHVRDGLSSVRLLLHPGLANRKNALHEVKVTVSARAGESGQVHAWIERDRSGVPQSRLIESADCSENASGTARTTLTPLACASGAISVAGLDNSRNDDAALPVSGRGPSPWPLTDDERSPLLAAPAHGLFGARSKTSGYMRGSGTSGAAALVSGATALAMQAAARAGQRLDHTELLKALLGGDPTNLSPNLWRSDLGYGALHFAAPFTLPTVIAPRSSPRPNTVPRLEVMSHERTISP